ncbi:hypothetical protein BDQ12DRAFT_688221 [Crucibulum laeve]|uniref:Uncharacterized protein n=1 Tax=Crucibulum laeve TaxID=68775 RepID=A0A5C3M336_9AGAR|nr:hypothetical protein BDQ12DRAFT_688221 [Crucibulum laeve]
MSAPLVIGRTPLLGLGGTVTWLTLKTYYVSYIYSIEHGGLKTHTMSIFCIYNHLSLTW